MQKRGLSTVVTTLIIVLLSLVAIGIVWVVISNILKQGTEEITLGKFTISMDIKAVTVNADSVDVKVKRNSGAGELTGINFIINDGVNTQVFKNTTNLQELGEKTFSLNYTGLVKEISIAPVFETSSEKEFFGNEIDNYKTNFIGLDVLTKEYKLISWWRFEGNAQDEVSDNHGTCINCPVLLEGKLGQAYEFNNLEKYTIADSNSLDITENALTLAAWFKPSVDVTNMVNTYPSLISKRPWQVGGYMAHFTNTHGLINIQYCWIGGCINANSDTSFKADNWYYYVGIIDTSELRIYINGALEQTLPITNKIDSSSGTNLEIGYAFEGIIDEVMIFNKALSKDEVKSLYELDLS